MDKLIEFHHLSPAVDALVIVDMQNWMFRLPERRVQKQTLITNISRLMAIFESVNFPIYNIRTEHKADRSTWSQIMLKYDCPCLLENTPDVEPVSGYHPSPSAIDVTKTTNSAFNRTDFHHKLQQNNVDRIILAGVLTDDCFGLTAADATQLGYNVLFIDDAICHSNLALHKPISRWLLDNIKLDNLNTQEFIRTTDANYGYA